MKEDSAWNDKWPICAANESTAGLATEAGRKALETAGVRPQDLDLIILATDMKRLRNWMSEAESD